MPDVINIFSDSWSLFVTCLLPKPSLMGVDGGFSANQRCQASLKHRGLAVVSDSCSIHWPCGLYQGPSVRQVFPH